MLTVRDAVGSPKFRVQGESQFLTFPEDDETRTLLIGPTERGPAYVPTGISSINELDVNFGLGETYTTYTAREYLQEADFIQIIRTMNEEGWHEPNPISLFVEYDNDLSGVAGKRVLLAILVISDSFKEEIDISKTSVDGYNVSDTGAFPTISDFVLNFKNSDNELVRDYRISFDRNSRRYIETVLSDVEDVNIYHNYDERQQTSFKFDDDLLINLKSDYDEVPLDFFDRSYSNAMTPWVTSQTLSDGRRLPLFRFVALGAGRSENRRIKIGINEIGVERSDSDYKFFNVEIRDINDNDFNPVILEEFEEVTLDPNHERFIPRVIGNRYQEFTGERIFSNGEYLNNSDYVRIELHPDVQAAGVNVMPFGFTTYFPTISGDLLEEDPIDPEEASFSFNQTPKFRFEQSVGPITDYIQVTRPEVSDNFQDQIHLGFDFSQEENWNFLNPIPSPFHECFYVNPNLDQSDPEYQDSCPVGIFNEFQQETFNLEDAQIDITDIDSRKFVLGLQGGFDGENPYQEKSLGGEITSENFYGYDLSGRRTVGTDAYRKALDLIRQVESGIDLNLLVTPGLNLKDHLIIISEIEELVRERGDVFYLFDVIGAGGGYQEAISEASRINSNYVGAYYGWLDTEGIDVYHDLVPASAVVPRVYSFTDKSAAPWFAPAGFRRGVVRNVSDVEFRLTDSQMDLIYENNINPLNYFGPDRVVVWGQKTLYDLERSKLNRINVRRLLVQIISDVRQFAKNILFDQNTQQTLNSFIDSIRDYLTTIRVNQGLEDFLVEISRPQDSRQISRPQDNYTIEGTIRLIPIDAVEYVFLNFTIQEQIIDFNITS